MLFSLVYVPLGVLQRNENKVDEMCEIMDEIHKYVPSRHVTALFPLFHEEDDVEYDDEVFHKILLGGDQVTVARARSSIAARLDHPTLRERLQGLLPVVEDWHAKQCLLKVCTVSYIMYTSGAITVTYFS